MRVGGISFCISAKNPESVNVSHRQSSKTNKLSSVNLGARALEESLRGTLFQLQLQLLRHPPPPHTPGAAVKYEEDSSWRIAVLHSRDFRVNA